MSLLRENIRPDLQSGLCEKCGEHIPGTEDYTLTFYAGCFIILHDECSDFIRHATKGPRKCPNSKTYIPQHKP